MLGDSSPLENNMILPRALPDRDVARPVANLGNTCYMNAVLQALSHAPELCMAMDIEPHQANCPVWLENAQKRRSSPSSSPDAVSDSLKPAGTRKSRRSGKKSPTSQQSDSDCKFCALCEVEEHLTRVHSNTNNRDSPVAPSMFVHGFIDRVAPWFKLGQQEDSHEFLRLLIDAMQKSCKQARTPCNQENPQDTPPEKGSENGNEEDEEKPADAEYPFQLFRGMVESNVTCESCKACSATVSLVPQLFALIHYINFLLTLSLSYSQMDPIEDIGLDVSPQASSTSSPLPGFLADVGTALQRFARAEELDAGYKCEKCGKVGRATKQSRLASIPPILTLHLKRFRYGETQKEIMVNTGGGGSRRSNRSSEVTQLLGSNGGSDFFAGKSGAAKIEGHSKFEQILDLKPYLTDELQAKHSNMFCRLFAVIVHAGKNSHSGHYISYVRNLAKNEWWKMDDARVTVASVREVMEAEAYMLFYRVVEHPFSIQLRDQTRKIQNEYKKAVPPAIIKVDPASETNSKIDEAEVRSDPATPKPATSHLPSPKLEEGSANNNGSKTNQRKRKAPENTCGEDWARAKTTLPDHLIAKFRDIEVQISEYIQVRTKFCLILVNCWMNRIFS